MHVDPAALQPSPPAATIDLAGLRPETKSALTFFVVGRLVRFRRQWFRNDDERKNSEALQREAVGILAKLESILGEEFLEWAFKVVKSKQAERQKDLREAHVAIPRQRR